MKRLVILLMWAAAAGGSALADRPAREEKRDDPARFAVELHADIAYRDDSDADAVRHKLDIYVPKGQRQFPVMLFVHGGSWRSGSKEIYTRLGETFAAEGIGMVIVNYRLSPKVQHPAHIEDIARAFAWTHAHIAKFGGRHDRIFLFGHSAGAHLVSLLATDARYLKNENRKLEDIRGVIAVSGVYELMPLFPLFRSAFGDKDSCREASPLGHVNRQCPPFLIMYGERDLPTLGKMSEDLRDELRKKRCDASIQKLDDRNHFTIIAGMQKDDDAGREAILEFIHKHSDFKPRLRPLRERLKK